MKVSVKRVYEKADVGDGFRVLVDRLWPRGVSKEKARIDLWAKDVAPSDALRRWYHADNEKRFTEFSKKYTAELKEGKAAELKKALRGKKKVTLVTGVKEIELSHIPALLRAIA